MVATAPRGGERVADESLTRAEDEERACPAGDGRRSLRTTTKRPDSLVARFRIARTKR